MFVDVVVEVGGVANVVVDVADVGVGVVVDVVGGSVCMSVFLVDVGVVYTANVSFIVDTVGVVGAIVVFVDVGCGNTCWSVAKALLLLELFVTAGWRVNGSYDSFTHFPYDLLKVFFILIFDADFFSEKNLVK